jgi:serine/threonine-protein kinase
MASPQYPPPATDRWNLNLPLLIGLVFVFLIGVVIWVIAASGDGDGAASSGSLPSSSVAPTAPVGSSTSSTSVPPGTTPAPMPDATAITSTTPPTTPPSTPPTTAPPTTAPPTTQPPTTTTPPGPPTTAAGAEPGAVPGDLAIDGYAMQAPPCNDSFITILASAVGGQASADGIEAVLESYPTSNYLRTDQTCPSLTQSMGGEPIYVVFFGPFAVADDACAARSRGPEGAYARRLSDSVGPNHSVACPS